MVKVCCGTNSQYQWTSGSQSELPERKGPTLSIPPQTGPPAAEGLAMGAHTTSSTLSLM